jgi:hypothetical protein
MEAHDSWGRGEGPIYVYPPDQPRTGTIPIYVHTPSDKGPKENAERKFYDAKIPNSSGWENGVLVFYALPPLAGYAVGEKAHEVSGQDQSGKRVNLSTYNPGAKGWVLIDICAEWCPACNNAAPQTRAFVNNVNSSQKELSLKLFTVLF